MVGVLIGFAIIAVVIGAGYAIARIGVLPADASRTLSRLAFFVLLPCLLFTVLADADLRVLFSAVLPVSAIAAVIDVAIFMVVALLIWKRPLAESTVGALGAGYVNGNNIGLPVGAYVLGSASSSAPVILFQLLLMAPIALTVLDISTSGRLSLRRVLLQPLRNPLILASALGIILAVTGVKLPDPVMQPFVLIGGAAVPVVLIGFGMSLHGQRPLAAGTDRRMVLLASAFKLALMPAIAWLFGDFVFGLHGHALFVVVVLAALPAAQNVFNYAQRYGRGVALARDIVLITTALSLPVVIVIAALLAPG